MATGFDAHARATAGIAAGFPIATATSPYDSVMICPPKTLAEVRSRECIGASLLN
jgi:hypothetical protein